MSPYFCYREAKNQQELEALLCLRYKVYRNSRLAGFCPENPWDLDIDCYDCYARHLGLFYCENGEESPIGYMRVIQEEETPAAVWVRYVARQYSLQLLSKVYAEPKNPFPVMNYFQEAKELVGKMHQDMKARGEQLCEASRFIIDPAFASRRLGMHLIEASIAIYFFALGFQNAVISCSENHLPAYRRYFFEQVSGSVKQEIKEFTGNGALLLLLLSLFEKNASSKLKNRIKFLSKIYREHGCICFHPHRPGEYARPTATGVPFQKIVMKKSLIGARIAAIII